MKGYFISVEGGDGSGKSTQMQKIEAYLTEMGQEVLLTREPGGTPMAEKTENLQKIHPALSRFLLKSRPFYGMIRIS